jgi:hypothetical protein
MVAVSSALSAAAAAAAGGTLEAALKHAPAALMKFNVSHVQWHRFFVTVFLSLFDPPG